METIREENTSQHAEVGVDTVERSRNVYCCIPWKCVCNLRLHRRQVLDANSKCPILIEAWLYGKDSTRAHFVQGGHPLHHSDQKQKKNTLGKHGGPKGERVTRRTRKLTRFSAWEIWELAVLVGGKKVSEQWQQDSFSSPSSGEICQWGPRAHLRSAQRRGQSLQWKRK